jgi:hypothetical protein
MGTCRTLKMVFIGQALVTHVYSPNYFKVEMGGGLQFEASPGKMIRRLHLNQ